MSDQKWGVWFIGKGAYEPGWVTSATGPDVFDSDVVARGSINDVSIADLSAHVYYEVRPYPQGGEPGFRWCHEPGEQPRWRIETPVEKSASVPADMSAWVPPASAADYARAAFLLDNRNELQKRAVEYAQDHHVSMGDAERRVLAIAWDRSPKRAEYEQYGKDMVAALGVVR